MYIGSAVSAPIDVKRKFGDVGFQYGRSVILSWRMHNRQAEITVLAVYGLVVCVVGLAAVFTGTDKPAAEGVPIVQENGGLSVYQALGGTDAAVPPKRVKRQFGDVALHDDWAITLSCRPHYRNAETSGFRQGMCRLHEGVLQDNGRFGRFDTQTIYGRL